MPLLNGASATDAFWLGLILSFSQSVSFDLKLKVDIVNLLWPSRTSFPILTPAPAVISGHPDILVSLSWYGGSCFIVRKGNTSTGGRWQTGVGWTRILWKFSGILSRKISFVVSIPFAGGGAIMWQEVVERRHRWQQLVEDWEEGQIREEEKYDLPTVDFQHSTIYGFSSSRPTGPIRS